MCEERGITYPALGVVDEIFDFIKQDQRDELRAEHTRGINPEPVIFPIAATADLNNQIAIQFKLSLQKRLWSFLVNDGDGEEFLIKNLKEFAKSISDSYIQTGLFIGECINLDMKLVSGKVQLEEAPGSFKDRYSAVSYANWVISHLDHELVREEKEHDMFDEIAAMTVFM